LAKAAEIGEPEDFLALAVVILVFLAAFGFAGLGDLAAFVVVNFLALAGVSKTIMFASA
jgi:hypothetical protein